MKKIIIAIDGFSSCGKSTMAKALARNIGYLYFDSGAMYRAVALYCMQNRLIKGEEIDTEALRRNMKDIPYRCNPVTGGVSLNRLQKAPAMFPVDMDPKMTVTGKQIHRMWSWIIPPERNRCAAENVPLRRERSGAFTGRISTLHI